jgi:hypothetical protein
MDIENLQKAHNFSTFIFKYIAFRLYIFIYSQPKEKGGRDLALRGHGHAIYHISSRL